MKYFFAILLIFVVSFNIYATYKIFKRDSLESFQRIVFSIIVWLIPIIGAFGILLFFKDDDTPGGPGNPNDSINSIMGPAGMGTG